MGEQNHTPWSGRAQVRERLHAGVALDIIPVDCDLLKRKRMEAGGWKVGGAKEFLNLSVEEAAYIELRLKLAGCFQPGSGADHFAELSCPAGHLVLRRGNVETFDPALMRHGLNPARASAVGCGERGYKPRRECGRVRENICHTESVAAGRGGFPGTEPRIATDYQ
jgi:hypothetical protein